MFLGNLLAVLARNGSTLLARNTAARLLGNTGQRLKIKKNKKFKGGEGCIILVSFLVLFYSQKNILREEKRVNVTHTKPVFNYHS